MLAFDDNRLKLLKMKEKLLEVSFDNRDLILSQYKDIVLDIDRNMYDRLINIIRNANYHNQALPEQLEILTNIENEYNCFNEFQCRYRDIYERYASDKLTLSPIEDIYIDVIRKRIDAINGYLVNNQNLLKYRKKLEELNIQLIDAEKKKSEIEERFDLLEQELVNSVLNAEGRLDSHGTLEYASIVNEFLKYDFNLKELLNDSNLLQQKISEASGILSSEEDKMEAAKVCFNNMPNIETKKLYNASYFDVLNARYKLNLLNFASLVAKQCGNYEEIKDKRIKLNILMRERLKLLNDLGIKFVIDPFERIKINEQLEIIELLGKNLQDVLFIKSKINDTFNVVDEINTKNNELYSIIRLEVDLFNDKDSIKKVNNDFDTQNVQEDSGKVIKIRDISNRLNLKLVHGKTSGVISRVYELFYNVPVTTKTAEVVPNLVIQKDSIFTDESKTTQIFDDNSDDGHSVSDVSVSFENEHLGVKDSVFVDETGNQSIVTDSNLTSGVDTELFSEVEPFQATQLFTSKYDDIFTNNKVKIEDNEEMPELFFETGQNVFDQSEEENTASQLSLDEQIKALKLVS